MGCMWEPGLPGDGGLMEESPGKPGFHKVDLR
jgi:hypothetical protein